MVNSGQQMRMKRRVERLFYGGLRTALQKAEPELAALGFVEIGANPRYIAFENRMMELYLEVGINADGSVHDYLVIPFSENEKRRKHVPW